MFTRIIEILRLPLAAATTKTITDIDDRTPLRCSAATIPGGTSQPHRRLAPYRWCSEAAIPGGTSPDMRKYTGYSACCQMFLAFLFDLHAKQQPFPIAGEPQYSVKSLTNLAKFAVKHGWQTVFARCRVP